MLFRSRARLLLLGSCKKVQISHWAGGIAEKRSVVVKYQILDLAPSIDSQKLSALHKRFDKFTAGNVKLLGYIKISEERLNAMQASLITERSTTSKSLKSLEESQDNVVAGILQIKWYVSLFAIMLLIVAGIIFFYVRTRKSQPAETIQVQPIQADWPKDLRSEEHTSELQSH